MIKIDYCSIFKYDTNTIRNLDQNVECPGTNLKVK